MGNKEIKVRNSPIDKAVREAADRLAAQRAAAAEKGADRDEHGHWLPGHKQPGPGRLPRRVDQEYLHVFLGQCDLEKWGQIVARAVQDALSDDVNARRYARDWLGRILIPAVERIIITSLAVNVETQDTLGAVRKLVQMLSVDDKTVEGRAVDITHKTT